MPINIALYYNEITQDILTDPRFVELQTMLSEKENLNKYIYALYSDINLLRENLFMPIFHSIYLGSGKANVILESINDDWLLSAFPNNTYFYMGDDETTLNNEKIIKIKSIKEIGQ
jgi:hypothetical protein